jgi:hypothetical protein
MVEHSGQTQDPAKVAAISESEVQGGQIVFGAIGGFALAFIIQLAGDAPPSDPWLRTALYFCVCLIPVSIIGFLIKNLEGRYKQKYKPSRLSMYLLFIAIIICCQGAITAVFTYYDYRFGLTFFGLMMLGNCYYLYYYWRLRQLNLTADEQPVK